MGSPTDGPWADKFYQEDQELTGRPIPISERQRASPEGEKGGGQVPQCVNMSSIESAVQRPSKVDRGQRRCPGCSGRAATRPTQESGGS